MLNFIKFCHFLIHLLVPSPAKYPLLTEVPDFAKSVFLRYLDLYYVNPANQKLKTFTLLWAEN